MDEGEIWLPERNRERRETESEEEMRLCHREEKEKKEKGELQQFFSNCCISGINTNMHRLG